MRIKELFEGIHDKYIFKAILVAGSPGSGKTTISRKLLSHLGFKEINIDKFIELLGSKQNLNMRNMDDWNTDIFDKSQELRDKTLDLALKGRLPILIDGTGRNYDRITSTSEVLKKTYGYDVGLLFVNVSLETAMNRNKIRGEKMGREVNYDYLKTAWADTQNNIGKFQNYFGNDMFIVDNNDTPDLSFTYKRIQKFINRPVHNPIAHHWLTDKEAA